MRGHGKSTLTFPLRSELGAYIGLLEGGETALTGPLTQSQGGSVAPARVCAHLGSILLPDGT